MHTAFISLQGWEVDGEGRQRPTWEYMVAVRDEAGETVHADLREQRARGPMGEADLREFLDDVLAEAGWRRAAGAQWGTQDGWFACEVEPA